MYRSLDCLCTSCAAADQVASIWPYFGNLQLLTGICLVLCCNREIGPLLVFNNQPFAAVVVVALKRVVVASLREQQWLIGSTPDCHMQSQIQICNLPSLKPTTGPSIGCHLGWYNLPSLKQTTGLSRGCHLGWYFTVFCPLRGGREKEIHKRAYGPTKQKEKCLSCAEILIYLCFVLHSTL